MDRRIVEARRLLETTTLAVTEIAIALESEFNDSIYCNRAFR